MRVGCRQGLGVALLLAGAVASAAELELSLSPEGERADERALYYYAAEGERERLLSEARRLRALDPEWSVPEDLFSPDPGGLDTTPVWRALERGAIGEAQARLAALRAEHPEESVPEDLTVALAHAEAAERVRNAREAGEWRAVARVLEAHPGLLTCNRIDMLWAHARAAIEADEEEAGLASYRRVVRECDDPEAALATVQKAWGRVSRADHERLVADFRARHGTREDALEAVLAELRGGGIGARIGAADSPLPAGLLERFGEDVRARENRREANLIGWYHYRMGGYEAAGQWFARSNDWGTNANALEGLTLVALERGRYARAESRVAPWLGRWDQVDDAWVALASAWLADADAEPPDGEALERMRERSESAPELAEAIGWHDHRRGEHDLALAAFRGALEADASPERVLGAVLAARELGREELISDLEARFGDRGEAWEEALAAAEEGGGGAAALAWSQGDAAGCYEGVAEARREGRLAGDLARLGGWCLLELERPSEARRYFEQARSLAEGGEARAEAAYGLAVVSASEGDISEAVRLAERGGVADERIRDLQGGLFAERALEAFEAERFEDALVLLERAPRSRDLDMLRAWSLFQAGRPEAAHALFERLDEALSTEETRLGLEVSNEARVYMPSGPLE